MKRVTCQYSMPVKYLEWEKTEKGYKCSVDPELIGVVCVCGKCGEDNDED